MLKHLGSKYLTRVFLSLLVPGLLCLCLELWKDLHKASYPSWGHSAFVGLASSVVLLGLIWPLVLTWATVLAYRLVRHAAKIDQTPAARRASGVCFTLVCITVSSTLSTSLCFLSRHYVPYVLLKTVRHEDINMFLCKTVTPIEFVDTLSNIALGLFSSGIFGGALRYTQGKDSVERMRQQKRRRIMAHFEPSGPQLWQDKVWELAGRGFTLKALLDFYRGLGRDYMPHYDPGRSRTRDVVRAAIIPLTRERQCSYAEVMMQGVWTEPQTMVTHAWLNLFGDLVGAIVADALGEETFEFAVFLLNQRPDELEKALRKRKTLFKTYWVCAFSVNQHAAICGFNPDVDEVTGERAPPCDCGRVPAWSSTQPLLQDGRSIPCEMNKFDDMMRLLASCNAHVTQVVALDRRCATLRRCWCVAEIVEAHKTEMRQSILVFSAASLHANVGDINGLRVEDMEASYTEDVALILAKIPNKDDFNIKYRSIVKQAVADWSTLIHSDKLTRAGRFWFEVASKHQFFRITG